MKYLLSLILLIFTTTASATEAAKKAVESADKYPGIEWTLKNLKGQDISIKDYKGKPVLLVFWATWCPYCKKLFPGVNRVYEKYKDQGFTVIAMNVREDGDPSAYMKERGYQFEVALDADEIGQEYGIRGTPTLAFISTKGEVLGLGNFSNPDHPALEYFAKEQLGLLEEAAE